MRTKLGQYFLPHYRVTALRLFFERTVDEFGFFEFFGRDRRTNGIDCTFRRRSRFESAAAAARCCRGVISLVLMAEFDLYGMPNVPNRRNVGVIAFDERRRHDKRVAADEPKHGVHYGVVVVFENVARLVVYVDHGLYGLVQRFTRVFLSRQNRRQSIVHRIVARVNFQELFQFESRFVLFANSTDAIAHEGVDCVSSFERFFDHRQGRRATVVLVVVVGGGRVATAGIV